MNLKILFIFLMTFSLSTFASNEKSCSSLMNKFLIESSSIGFDNTDFGFGKLILESLPKVIFERETVLNSGELDYRFVQRRKDEILEKLNDLKPGRSNASDIASTLKLKEDSSLEEKMAFIEAFISYSIKRYDLGDKNFEFILENRGRKIVDLVQGWNPKDDVIDQNDPLRKILEAYLVADYESYMSAVSLTSRVRNTVLKNPQTDSINPSHIIKKKVDAILVKQDVELILKSLDLQSFVVRQEGGRIGLAIKVLRSVANIIPSFFNKRLSGFVPFSNSISNLKLNAWIRYPIHTANFALFYAMNTVGVGAFWSPYVALPKRSLFNNLKFNSFIKDIITDMDNGVIANYEEATGQIIKEKKHTLHIDYMLEKHRHNANFFIGLALFGGFTWAIIQNSDGIPNEQLPKSIVEGKPKDVVFIVDNLYCGIYKCDEDNQKMPLELKEKLEKKLLSYKKPYSNVEKILELEFKLLPQEIKKTGEVESLEERNDRIKPLLDKLLDF